MKRNGKNIITDQDITLTGGKNIGKSLDSVLNNQEERLDRIESNVKWIYKNGGVGSGSGGGSGSGSSRWTAVVYRTDTEAVLKDGMTMSLSGPGTYGVRIQIYKGGSDTFKVSLKYQTSRGNVSTGLDLNSGNSFSGSKNLNLDINGTLTIEIKNVSDPDEVPIIYSIPYITSTYSFDLYYVYADNHERLLAHSNNTIYMSQVKDRGLEVALDYSIAVDLQSSSFTYTNWDGDTFTITGDDAPRGKTSDIIYLPLCTTRDSREFLSDNDNARFKQFILDLNIVLENQTSPENIKQLSLKDNLIPSDIYLRVTASGGTLFESSQAPHNISDEFIVGTIVFNTTVFNGALTSGNKYEFSVFSKFEDEEEIQLGAEEGINITDLVEQTVQEVLVPVGSVGSYAIRFKIVEQRTGKDFEITYYLYTRKVTTNFSYYSSNPDLSQSAWYKKLGLAGDMESVLNMPALKSSTSIAMNTSSSSGVTYEFNVPTATNYEDYDQMLCLGLQYLRTNDINQPIASFNMSDDFLGSVFIYQNRVVVCKERITDLSRISGDSCEIYFPTCSTLNEGNSSEYHLITIYKRLVSSSDGNSWREINIYIDGFLEAGIATWTPTHRRYESITLYPGNYYVNLIENSCFVHTEETDKYSMSDLDIQGYNFAYRELLGEPIDSAEKVLFDNFRSFYSGPDGYIYTNGTAITNIAENSKVPVLMLEFTDLTNYGEQSINNIVRTYENPDAIKTYLSKSYGENEKPARVPVTVSYSQGTGENGNRASTLDSIKKDGSPAIFYIEPQGSSTRSFLSKNIELYAPLARDSSSYCVFSPNFDPADTNTFLPEESFTLKSDVVDSSHTNNNAIAAFVNYATTKFSVASEGQVKPNRERTKYADYIKNCLTGFPILVFLHSKYKIDNAALEADQENFYFLGIYNFNLGRNSEFNLGYKNTAAFEEIDLQAGFNIYEITAEQNSRLPGIMVAEIQGNDNHFDFSQYHGSILYQRDDQDETYMWGDFVNGISEDMTTSALSAFVKKVALAGGYIFETIGKKFSTSALDEYGYKRGFGYSAVKEDGTPAQQVPNYRFQAIRSQSGSETVYSFSETQETADRSSLLRFITTNPDEDDWKRGIDFPSLTEYYTTCMAFGMVDSVMKNLNVKSWNQGQDWYLAFYDMDTCLGVSNSGSRISYFAFSDYWDWKNSIDSEGNMGAVKIYRDYAPKSSSGDISGDEFFDTPSSYLFAIAKYAFTVLGGESGELSEYSEYTPSHIWAKWRRSTGVLANAKTFMNLFYKDHLKGVPQSAFNYNYRFKYFVRSAEGHSFDTVNFPKFYGRKIAYTENWLENRLHILDAYFNINGISDIMLDSEGYTTRVTAPMVTNPQLVDNNNPDIYLLHDIFGSGGSAGVLQYVASTYVSAKAKAYAPMVIKVANNSYRYMFTNDENKEGSFVFGTSGNQTVLFGGSALWTELDSINPFITQSKLQISSDYFTKIVGTSGVCSSWTFNVPSLRYLSLTNNPETEATYSGSISFDGTEKYPNLDYINISGTKIELEVRNSNVSTIYATSMKSGSSVKISNTPNLRDVRISGYIGDIELPGWGQTVSIPSDNTTISSGKIGIRNINYPNATAIISNAPNLEELTLTGFSKIVVYGCPKLRSIVLGDVEDKENFGLKTLDVTVPQVSPSSGIVVSSVLTIGPAGTEENTVDLTQWNLEALRLRGTTVTKVNVKDGCNINLFPGAFYECRSLETISGNSTFWIHSSEDFSDQFSVNPETFYNAIKFTALQENGDQVDLRVHENCTDLTRTFYIDYGKLGGHGKMELPEVSRFLSIGSENAGKVTSIESLFEGQTVKYDLDTLASEYNQGKCSLGLGNFTGCYKFQGVFRATNVWGYNRYMFTGLGSSASGIINNLVGQGVAFSQVISVVRNAPIASKSVNGNVVTDRVLYATTDFLQDIIDKIYTLTIGSQSDQNSRLCFIDPQTKQILDTVNIHDVFCPGGTSPIHLGRISYIEFFPGHILNMSGAFDWPGNTAPLNMSYFMYSLEYKYFTEGCLEELFFGKRINRATYSFNNLSGYQGEVNLARFIDWENIDPASTLFYEQSGVFSLGFKKKATYQDFQDIIWYNILKHPPQYMGGFFTDCTVYFASQEEANKDFELISESHSEENFPGSDTITDISFLFMALKAKISGGTGDYVPIRFTSRFMKRLPNVTVAASAFKNTYWANPIPWNFFRKRIKVTLGCYVWNGEAFIPGTLVKYDYKKDITKMSGCFSNIRLASCTSWKYDASYNDPIESWEIIGSDGASYDKCYESQSFESEIHDWAWEDAHEELHCAIPYSDWKPGGETSTVIWTNPIIATQEDADGLFVSPDIFYCCAAGADVEECFSAAAYAGNRQLPVFTGAIPKHLVWPLGKGSSLSGIMSNLNILPRLYGEYTTLQDGFEKINRCYYYVPSGYTTRTSLSGAFNFKMILPQENIKSGSKIYKDYYYILMSDSLPKDVVSLNNSFPSTGIITAQNWSLRINYLEGERVLSDGIYYAICGEPIEEEGEFVGMNTGLDLEYYDSLRLDGLIQASLASIMSGKIFKENLSQWSPSTYLSNISNYVVYLNSSGLSYAAQIYLPRLNKQFLSAGSPCYILSDSIVNYAEQVPSDTTPGGLANYPNVLVANI